MKGFGTLVITTSSHHCYVPWFNNIKSNAEEVMTIANGVTAEFTCLEKLKFAETFSVKLYEFQLKESILQWRGTVQGKM